MGTRRAMAISSVVRTRVSNCSSRKARPMPAKRPTPNPRMALRMGFGANGAVGTVAGTSTR